MTDFGRLGLYTGDLAAVLFFLKMAFFGRQNRFCGLLFSKTGATLANSSGDFVDFSKVYVVTEPDFGLCYHTSKNRCSEKYNARNVSF